MIKQHLVLKQTGEGVDYSHHSHISIDVAVRNSLSKHLLQSLCVALLDLVLLHFTNPPQLESTPSPMLKISEGAQEARGRLWEAYKEQFSRGETPMGGSQPFRISFDDAALLMDYLPQDAVDPFNKMRKLTAGSGKYKHLVEYLDTWGLLVKNSKLTLPPSNER